MNLDNGLLICQIIGGSHSYGLNTPTSDLDYRGVYVNTDVDHIVGLNSGRDECRTSVNESEDVSLTELRAYLRQLRGGNTQALELVYISEYEFISPFFQRIRDSRESLIDSEKLIKVLKGYAQGERRLANGERTGKLGGKRKAALDKYGFSPKNFVQLFRLLWAGTIFYEIGVFPVNVARFDLSFQKRLMDVKTHPENYDVKHLNEIADKLEIKLDESFAKTKVKRYFNPDIANDLCKEAYKGFLV